MAPSTTTATVATVLRPWLEQLFRGAVPMHMTMWDGSELGPDTATTIRILSPTALQRIMWSPGELGLSRAYVAGDIQLDGDIFDLLALQEHFAAPDGTTAEAGITKKMIPDLWRSARQLHLIGLPPRRPPEESRLRGWRHARGRDSAAISHHYDVGNDFYRLVLGESMTYSCAYWADDTFDLAQAEAAKYELVCRKLDLSSSDRLLDVGCGWGGMVLHAAQTYGVRAVGITLSREQAILARQRVADAGLADRIEIRVQDYRDISDGPFDAISSIGMFEHVGLEKMEEYLVDLYALLKPHGRLLNHAISRPSPVGNAAVARNSFMGRYVFPDSALLEVGTLTSAMQKHHLEVRDVESLREHYARTLRQWVANLEADWDTAQMLVGPARARIWRLYMAGSALGFEGNQLAIHQVLAVKTDSNGRSGIATTRRRLDLDNPLPQVTASN